MSLEKGTHLRVTGARPIEDHEVDLEDEHVDGEWNYDEANDPRDEMPDVSSLF